jgi:PKD repeat protein
VIINNAPTVNAGLDKTICEGSSILMSDASYGGSATSITWSGGSGSFTPSTSTLLATYNPDSIETGSTVRLYIETNDPAGPCIAARDSVDITIDIAPTVDAGTTKVVCGQDSVRLNDAGFGGSTTSIAWSGGAGTFYPNNTTLNAVYFPTAGEIGTIVTLTLSSNDPTGPCDIVTDQVDVNINTPPTVDAGVAQVVCESSSIIVSGSIGGGASSATWSGGLGTFVNNNLLITEYIPDSTEIGTIVTLRLTTDDPSGPCTPVFSEVDITIEEAPLVDAGLDQAICIGDTLFLNGSIGGSASSASWSGGIGSYSNINDLNAYYLPDTTERGSQIIFTLTTDDPAGPCPASDAKVFHTINALPNPTFFGLDPQIAINDPPINLNSSPSGGLFTGDGINPVGSNTFDPVAAGEGMTYVTYTYTDGNGCTNLYIDSTFVNPLPEIDFLGLDFAYCLDDEASTLTGIPAGGIFQGPGIQQSGSEYQFDPAVADVGIHTIQYIFTDPLGVTDTTEGITRVLPIPVADFTFDVNNTCVDDSIPFTDLSSIDTSVLYDSIANYTWIFPDTIYSQQNPVHKFADPKIEAILLRVESQGFSTKSCTAEKLSQVYVGGKPEVNFTSELISEGSITNFYSDITFPTSEHEFDNGNIAQWLWDFDDAGATSSLQDPSHTFTGSGQYNVSLSVVSSRGCPGDTVKIVSIVPSISVPSGAILCQDFETDNGGWAISPNPALDSNSWEHGVPAGNTINYATSGSSVWMTGRNQPYYDGERSYLITPAYDISALERPMLSFNYWSELGATDGVVMQYSDDGGLTWNVVGAKSPNEPNGVRWWGNEWWYNYENISADPGEQQLDPTNNVGWTLESGGWVNARIPLDQIPTRLTNPVIFRFAFASVETSVPNTLDGFAIDDFCIGNRTRNVLVEHFVNFELNTTQDTRDLYDVINSVPNELVYIEFHHGYQGGDLIYNENQILGDRANYYSAYGATTTSFKSFIDGAPQSDGVVLDYYEVIDRALQDPKVDINITVDSTLGVEPDRIEIHVRTTALETITDDVSLFITLVEDNLGAFFPDYGVTVQNLARAMFKDEPTYTDGLSGINIAAPWNPGDPELVFHVNPGETLTGFPTYNTDEYWVVAYIQDNQTNEVLQAEMVKVDNDKTVVTDLEEDIARGVMENVNIYPQPAKEYAIVEFGDYISQDYDWEIMDQRGVAIGRGKVEKGSKGFEIDTSLLPNGIHFLLIGDKEGLKLHRKLTIIH